MRVTPDNLDDAVRSYFSERYAHGDFSALLDDLFRIYDRYNDKELRNECRVVSRRLGEMFAERETVRSFKQIVSGIQWHPKDSVQGR